VCVFVIVLQSCYMYLLFLHTIRALLHAWVKQDKQSLATYFLCTHQVVFTWHAKIATFTCNVYTFVCMRQNWQKFSFVLYVRNPIFFVHFYMHEIHMRHTFSKVLFCTCGKRFWLNNLYLLFEMYFLYMQQKFWNDILLWNLPHAICALIHALDKSNTHFNYFNNILQQMLSTYYSILITFICNSCIYSCMR